MVTVSSTTGTSQIRTLEETQRNTSSSLGRTDFLRILVAQLSNQNPMEPTSDTEFIAQLAQFSLLEEMQTMSAGFMTSQAYSLIGKMVYVDGETELVYGKVDGVIRRNGIDYLLIGEDGYPLSLVRGVLSEDTSLGLQQDILQSANLIGKTVTATIYDESEEPVTITGQVEKIIIQDNAVFAVVSGKNIPISGIEQIAQTTFEEEHTS